MSKEEPAWRAELEKELAAALRLSDMSIATRVMARDAVLPPVWAAILAAEQRGFQAGVNKTGDSVGKLREQLKAAKGLVRDFIDPDACHYDHHGYCQAHGWFLTEPACPHARAKKLFPESP